jgi:hypothetical protein
VHRARDYRGRRPGCDFEWSPITPNIVAGQKAERELRAAIGDLNMAGQSKGFGLNRLTGLHELMLRSFEEFVEQLDYSVQAARNNVEVLEDAHRDYTASNDASLDEYLALTRMLDGVGAEYGKQQSAAEDAERQRDAAAEEQLQITMGNKELPNKVMAPALHRARVVVGQLPARTGAHMSFNFETSRTSRSTRAPGATTARSAVAHRPIYDMADLSKGAGDVGAPG